MKPHYYEVIADLRVRIANATEELTLLDVAHNQIATRRVELQTNRAGMEELAEELEEFIAQLGLEEPPTPEEAKPLRLEAGKRYVRRDGQITGPLIARDSEYYPFHEGSSSPFTWGGNGRYNGPSDTPLDLIAEYVEPDSSEGWEFFQEGTEYFWAYPKDGVEGLFYARCRPSWCGSGQTKEEAVRYCNPIPNLPPGIPMP